MKKPPSKKRKWLWIALAVIVLAATAAIVYFSIRETPTPVVIDKVKKGSLSQVVSASGRANPAVKVEISANISGEIRQLGVREGQSVAKGDLLVTLDNRRYQATNDQSQSALRAASAQVRLAEAQATLAQRTFERQKELFTHNLTSKEALDSAETQHNVARASLDAARDAARQAEASHNITSDELSKTTIRAPMDGVVTRLAKEEGEIALGSAFTRDVIMDISDPNQIVATVDVDEADVVRVQIGNAATVKVDALPDQKFQGKVIEIAGSAKIQQLGTQEQTVSFEVKVLLEGDTAAIRPGMSATADIVTATRDDVFQAPIQCITMRDPEALAKAEKGKSEKGADGEAAISGDIAKMKELVFQVKGRRAQPLWVTVGISSDTHMEVAGEGLAEGLELVCGPFKTLNRTLQPGELVERKSTEKKSEEK